MELLTDEQRARLMANGERFDQDHVPVVKWFLPDMGAVWLVTHLDPNRPDVAHGLADLGYGMPEIGTFGVSELRELKGPAGESVQRDVHCELVFPVSEYAVAARKLGRITDDLAEVAEAVQEAEGELGGPGS